MKDNQEQQTKSREQEQNNKKKKRNKITAVIIMLILLILLLSCCCSSCSYMSPSDISQCDIEWNQPKASRDLQAEVDKAVEQGIFNVFMNTNIVFKDGQSKGNLLIQNAETNIYPMYVEIYNNDTLLYKSDIIEPGYKIEEAKLDTVLSKGTYDYIAYFYVTDNSKEEVQNKIGLNIKITVNN